VDTLQGQKIHFIGIGGSGMSGLARIALADGISVSGSDAKESSILSALAALGARVYSHHEAAHVEGADCVVYSTAISASNPEMAYAVERSIPILTRAQALALLMKGSKSIAVAGTHGKTTTSSMMTVALQTCGVRSIICYWWNSDFHLVQMLIVAPESILLQRQMNQMVHL